ncbi:MAG: Crp/Fnr family transcriptional regulator [Culturomica sp.]|jgi:CRP-like cAMP-binding protein|nr:Crp/Fnr family transcriptional regulator [Culturomica sp.]
METPDNKACCDKLKQTFKTLSEAELKNLADHEPARSYKKGTLIYSEGDRMKGCYFIYSGAVKVFQTGREGKEQIIKFEKEGDFFGFRSVILKEKACTSVEVLSDTVLGFMPEQVVLELIRNNPAFAYELMQIACKELGESNRSIRDIAQKSVKKRLAEILLMLAADFGVEKDGTLRLSISREDLGNFAGTATETIIRLLSEYKNEGLVESKGRKIKLLDTGKLKKVAGY